MHALGAAVRIRVDVRLLATPDARGADGRQRLGSRRATTLLRG
jgi:hypothetical protein